MHWNNRLVFVGYSSKHIRTMADAAISFALYTHVAYVFTTVIHTAPDNIHTEFTHQVIIDNGGQDCTKAGNGSTSTLQAWNGSMQTCCRS